MRLSIVGSQIEQAAGHAAVHGDARLVEAHVVAVAGVPRDGADRDADDEQRSGAPSDATRQVVLRRARRRARRSARRSARTTSGCSSRVPAPARARPCRSAPRPAAPASGVVGRRVAGSRVPTRPRRRRPAIGVPRGAVGSPARSAAPSEPVFTGAASTSAGTSPAPPPSTTSTTTMVMLSAPPLVVGRVDQGARGARRVDLAPRGWRGSGPRGPWS